MQMVSASARCDGLMRRVPRIAIACAVDLAAPVVLYGLLRAPLGIVGALMAASLPLWLWSLVALARRGRFDPLAIMMLLVIAAMMFDLATCDPVPIVLSILS